MTPEGRIVRPLEIVKQMSKVFSQMTMSLTLLKLSKLETTSDGKVLTCTTMNTGSISTHMQACPPAMNVILIYQTSIQNQIGSNNQHRQVWIYARNTSLGDAIRKRRKPSLRFPLVGIRSPYIHRSVYSTDSNEDVGALRHEDLADLSTISTNNRFGEWEYRVFPSPK